MRLSNVLKSLQANGANDDYQIVGSSEEEEEEEAEYGVAFGEDERGVAVQRGISRCSIVSPRRRFVPIVSAFLVGCAVVLLLTSRDGGDSVALRANNKQPKHDKPKPHKQDVTLLSLVERENFMPDAYKHDLAALQQPKETPSGWWPDELWIHDCANKKRDLGPFNTNPDWVDYRLGDCIKLCGGCPDKKHPQLMHNATMGGQYYDLACDKTGPQWHVKRGNETLLNSIIDGMENRPGFAKPDPEAIVIHLRLGDKMEVRIDPMHSRYVRNGKITATNRYHHQSSHFPSGLSIRPPVFTTCYKTAQILVLKVFKVSNDDDEDGVFVEYRCLSYPQASRTFVLVKVFMLSNRYTSSCRMS